MTSSHFINCRKVAKFGPEGLWTEGYLTTFPMCVHPELDATKTSKFITTNTVGKFPMNFDLLC